MPTGACSPGPLAGKLRGEMTNASQGYDLPAFEKLTTFKVWAEESPPKGTLYHYPNPHNHQTRSRLQPRRH